jgi:hypothetical protein
MSSTYYYFFERHVTAFTIAMHFHGVEGGLDGIKWEIPIWRG